MAVPKVSVDLEACPVAVEAPGIEQGPGSLRLDNNEPALPQEKIVQEDAVADNLIDFDGIDDPEDPLNWSSARKWSTVALISSMTLMVNLATIMSAPAAPEILVKFDETDKVYSTILVSIWELGQVLGPLLIAPLAEIYGKFPVYNAANILFIVFSLGGGFSQSLTGVIICRLFNGAACASSTLNPGIVGDMFKQEQRGRAISIMSLSVLLGPTLGPVIGGYLTQSYGWRWIFWFTAIVTGALEVAFLLLFRETYRFAILRKKAARLRTRTGVKSLRTKGDPEDAQRTVLLRALIRPLKIMFLSPVVLLLAIYVATVYAYVYLVMTSIAGIFEQEYHFKQGPVGLSFLGLGIGIGLGILGCGALLDWYLKRRAGTGEMKLEYRLPFLTVSGFLIPTAFFIYGWTLEKHVHWIVPILSTTLIGFALVATTIPSSTYLVDSFGRYTSSAIAALSVWKFLFGAFLPLAGPALYQHLGYGWGNSLLAFIALALVPAPLALVRYGAYLRTAFKLNLDI